MITREQLPNLIGADVRDRTDQKVGTVGHAYVDDAGTLTWMSVKTGWFGRKENLAPMETAEIVGDQVQIPYEKNVVKDAPAVDIGEEEPLSDAQVAELYRHYGLPMEDMHRPGMTPPEEEGAQASLSSAAAQPEMPQSDRPVVQDEHTPTEKIQKGKERITEEETLTDGELRREEIDIKAEDERGRWHRRR